MAKQTSIGLDLGGTNFSVAWLDESGALRDTLTLETQSHRPASEIVTDLASAIQTTAPKARQEGYTVIGSGIGVPAVIDPWVGLVLLPPNFAEGWHHYPLAATLTQATQIPTWLINDARSFTFAESRMGAGKGYRHLLGITLGTGVGGGLILNGQLYLGRWDTAGEFGHQVYDPQGPRCGCGGFGCIEVFASGPAIVAAAARHLRQGRTPLLREIIQGSLDNLSPKAVALAAQAGEEECIEIYRQVGRALGIGISDVLSVLELEAVVIGGGAARAGNLLFEPIWQTLEQHQYMVREHLSKPQIKPAQLNEPGVMGAAVYAAEQYAAEQYAAEQSQQIIQSANPRANTV